MPCLHVRAPKENRWPEQAPTVMPTRIWRNPPQLLLPYLLIPPTHQSLVPNISTASIVSTTMTEVAELKKPYTAGAAPASALPAPAASASLVPDPKPPAAGGMCYWPDQSCDSLPPLPGKVAAGLVGGRGMEFSVNEECTSLTLAPSGRHVVAGFTDGTIRLFDLTGRLWSPSRSGSTGHDDAAHFYDQDSDDDDSDDDDGTNQGGRHRKSASGSAVDDDMRDLFDHDSDDDDDDDFDGEPGRGGRAGASSSAGTSAPPSASRGRVASVCSKSNEQFGAVAAQIHAKGVITSLLMDVSIAQDGLYAFGGVLRGSMELVAIDLGKVEAYHDMITAQSGGRETRDGSDSAATTTAGGSGSSGVDILDLVSVYRHSDAKLKGFGACTRVRKDGEVEYRLFTGKGIKNIHIWSFIPASPTRPDPQWQCLYDTPTNGNTIKYLHFRYDPSGLLQGISKSDDQKLRVWDLSCEQGTEQNGKESTIKQLRKAKAKMLKQAQGGEGRPKKPPFVDVMSTESTLGVYGQFAFAGGAEMYNQMSVVNLDVEDVLSLYNVTELALPGVGEDPFDAFGAGGRRSRSGRQQRGDLKSVISVAGLESDAGHVLLELSDGSVAHYSQDSGAQARLEQLPSHLYKSSQEQRVSIMDGDHGAETSMSRRMYISRIGAEGIAVLASSTFNPNTARGTLMLSRLADSNGKTPAGFWGFHVPQDLPEKLLTKINKAKADAAAAALATPSKKKWRSDSGRSISTMSTIAETPAAQPVVTPSTRTLKAKKNRKTSTSPDGLPWQESNIVKGSTTETVAISPDVNAKSTKKPKKAEKKDAPQKAKKRSASPKPPKSTALTSPKKPSSVAGSGANRSRSKERLQSPQPNRVKNRAQLPRSPSPKPRKIERTRVPAAATLRWKNSSRDVSDFMATHHRHKRPRLLVQDLPKATVHQRVALSRQSSTAGIESTASGYASDATNPCDSTTLHEFERCKLAAEHRAGHEMMRKNLLSRMERQIDAWNAENIRSGGISPSFDKVKKWVDNTVTSYEEMLQDMLDRQRMEAETMAAMQTAENRGRKAALLQVSFPFPDLFDQVRTKVMGHFPSVPRELR